MKKFVALLLFSLVLLSFLPVFLFSIYSYNYKKFESCHPSNHPMSKWEGDAEGIHFEMYIGDEEHEGFVVVDYGNKKIPYLHWWHGNGLVQMTIRDVRTPSLDEKQPSLNQDSHFLIESWDIALIDGTHFKLTKGHEQISDAKCDILEVTLPDEIVMTRTQSELGHENFPKIERDKDYDLCPAYRYGTQWISDDNKVIICDIESSGTYCAGKSKVTFAAEPNSVYYIGFFEVNSKAYLIKWEEDSMFYFSNSKFLKATEEWQCEYYENYFIAKVIRSEHYEPGHIITFSLVEISPSSK